jgi:hypothetical protein
MLTMLQILKHFDIINLTLANTAAHTVQEAHAAASWLAGWPAARR